MLNEKLNYQLIDEELNLSDCHIGEYDGESFLIVGGCEQAEQLEQALGMSLDKATDGNWGYGDEYTICSECSMEVIRTSPDSYSWLPEYLLGDGFIACKKCASFDDMVQVKENDPGKADTLFSDQDFIDHGYEKLGDYESGWYGRVDSPREIFEQYRKNYYSIIFSITSSGQFNKNFTAYGKKHEDDEE